MDTFGLVAVEAQACGCATILPLNGPFSGCIHESLLPLLYDARIENELERKLIEFFESPMSLEQRQIVSNQISARFSWEHSGQQYVDLISSLPPLPRSARCQPNYKRHFATVLRPLLKR
jgi:glycosyltransferase involved in cell wall biosynthesis